MGPARRKDYARNLRAKVQKGCTWCGGEVPPPVTSATYCSDACVQADHEGIDDLPPVIPLSPGKAASARPWMSYEDRLREGRTN
jgi:hypothetical protein